MVCTLVKKAQDKKVKNTINITEQFNSHENLYCSSGGSLFCKRRKM